MKGDIMYLQVKYVISLFASRIMKAPESALFTVSRTVTAQRKERNQVAVQF